MKIQTITALSITCLTALCLAFPISGKAAEWRIYTGGETIAADSLAPGESGLVARLPGGTTRTVPLTDLLLLQNIGGRLPGLEIESTDFVIDTDGNLLSGHVNSTGADGILLKSPQLGDVSLSWDRVAALGFDRRTLERKALNDAPVIILRNGDPLSGEIGRVGADGIETESVFGSVEMAWDEIAAVVFRPLPPIPDGEERSLVFLKSGDEWMTSDLGIDADGWRIGNGFFGDQTVPFEEVRQLWFRGSRVVPLTEVPGLRLPPSRFLGQEIPTSVDGDLAGGALTIGSRVYQWGLACHAPASIEIPLPAGSQWLVGEVGLDPKVGAECQVTMDAGVTAADDLPVEMSPDTSPVWMTLKAGDRQELRLRFEDTAGTGGWVNLGEPFLIVR